MPTSIKQIMNTYLFFGLVSFIMFLGGIMNIQYYLNNFKSSIGDIILVFVLLFNIIFCFAVYFILKKDTKISYILSWICLALIILEIIFLTFDDGNNKSFLEVVGYSLYIGIVYFIYSLYRVRGYYFKNTSIPNRLIISPIVVLIFLFICNILYGCSKMEPGNIFLG